jgi:hypothetical protein
MAFKSFKDYISEEDITKMIVQTGVNSKGFDNPLTVQLLNTQLAKTTSHSFITPYIALGAISRVLAYANIILPQYVFLDKEEGEVVFDATHFGKVGGINLDGTKAESKEPDHFVYFSYEMNDEGYYDVFAALVTTDELEDIMTTEEVEETSEENQEAA